MGFSEGPKAELCWLSRELDLTDHVTVLGAIALFCRYSLGGAVSGNYSFAENLHVIAGQQIVEILTSKRSMPDMKRDLDKLESAFSPKCDFDHGG